MPKDEKEQKKQKNPRYTAEDIYVLEGLEPVRKRPGMYIGSTGPDGLHHLVWEIFDNSRDEAMGGFASEIEVALLPENVVRVADDGRGIPVDVHPKTKVSALETALTTLHAGGKFSGESYKISGGLHGVGASVVNALSVWLRAEVHRDGGVYVQEYDRGKPRAKVKKAGPSKQHGTIIMFAPDAQIFTTTEFDLQRIKDHHRQQAYLVKKLKVRIIDAREYAGKIDPSAYYLSELHLPVPEYTFYFEGGLMSLVKYLNKEEEVLHEGVFYVEKEHEKMIVEVALQYTTDIAMREMSFANNIHTPEGGTHLTGFRTALTRVLNDYARKNGLLKEADDNLSGEDVREGLTAVVSVKIPDPQFEGQTKAKLGSPEGRTAAEIVVGDAFSDFLQEHPQDARKIVERCILSQKARKAAKAARETVLRKGVLEGLALPGKLADCSSRDPEESELYIVEGDSAGGCFSGDTKVALTDGRNITFEELVREHQSGKKNFCYTIAPDGGIAIGEIQEPRITKKAAEVMKVILDSGEEIVCTPDHRFLLRNGEYKQAQNLVGGDALMPFRRQFSRIGRRITIEGYEMVFDPKDLRWIFTHLLSDRKKRKETYNKTYLEKGLTVLRRVFEKRGELDEAAYNDERKKLRDKSLLRLPTLTERFFDNDKEKLKEAVLNFNHKVKSVVRLNRKVDVYDLEVPGTHNFALASGVFVHNSAKQGRDRRFQAILPLKGKILNIEKARLDRMLASSEIRALIIALGTAIADEFDIGRLRYQRVIIMTDADVDGAHIRTLLLTLFYRYFRELIDRGYVYIAQPPLYRIQAGKKVQYAYSDKQKEQAVSELKKEAKPAPPVKGKKKAEAEVEKEAEEEAPEEETKEGKVRGVSIQRYKGLGEMNPSQLWETTMDPATRLMKRVAIADAQEADKIFDILMGSEVLPRKRFIQTHAKAVKNLDV